MGTYYLVVNPLRQQYLDPARFGEGIKFSSVLRGGNCLLALKLLISDAFEKDAKRFRGAWIGDPVVLAGDDGGLPNPGGSVTAIPEIPTRNLHALAKEEFVDISYRAIAELSSDHEIATSLAQRAKQDRSLLIDLGAVVEHFHPKGLDYALEQAVGRPWRKEYHKALMELSDWRPLPPIDWPL